MGFGMVEVVLRLTCPHCGEQSEVPIRRDEIVAEGDATVKAEPIATFRNPGVVSAAREFSRKGS